MNTAKFTFISAISIILITVFVIIPWVSASNSEIVIRNKIEAQIDVRESYYDKMWKIISGKAQVAEHYRDSFNEIYPKLIDGRYKNDNSLMLWIQESNPNFDTSLLKELSNTIEAERNGFFMEQKKLIDLDREHKTMRQVFPNSIFIGSRNDVEFVIVSSVDSRDAMETGNDDKVNIFN